MEKDIILRSMIFNHCQTMEVTLNRKEEMYGNIINLCKIIIEELNYPKTFTLDNMNEIFTKNFVQDPISLHMGNKEFTDQIKINSDLYLKELINNLQKYLSENETIDKSIVLDSCKEIMEICVKPYGIKKGKRF